VIGGFPLQAILAASLKIANLDRGFRIQRQPQHVVGSIRFGRRSEPRRVWAVSISVSPNVSGSSIFLDLQRFMPARSYYDILG
jgi:hypothetical protein